jgi:hypothetical protein
VFFSLSSWELWLLVFALIGGVAALGTVAGRFLGRRSDAYREPFGVLQQRPPRQLLSAAVPRRIVRSG